MIDLIFTNLVKHCDRSRLWAQSALKQLSQKIKFNAHLEKFHLWPGILKTLTLSIPSFLNPNLDFSIDNKNPHLIHLRMLGRNRKCYRDMKGVGGGRKFSS